MQIKESDSNKLREYYISSIINIGKFYENGYYFNKDYEQAKKWYRKAKDLGDKQPIAELLDRIKAEANEGLVNDLPDMLSYDEKYELAKRYLFGTGLEKSFEKALPLLLECAHNGICLAYKDLGLCYATGKTEKKSFWGYESIAIDCERNYSLGYKYLSECANRLEDGKVYYELGILYELGLGIQRNFSEALYWYRRAIDKNFIEAIHHIATLYRYGKIDGANEKCIICMAYSNIVSMMSSQAEWERQKEILSEIYPQINTDMFSPKFHVGRSIMEDCLNLKLLKYYVEILQKSGFILKKNINVIDLSISQDIEDSISTHWSSFESEIRKDFANLLNDLSPNIVSTIFSLDTNNKDIEAVDLGLPSGILWCNRNVYDNDTNSIGCLYAWAESKSKESFSWSNYFDHRSELSGKFKYINHNRAVYYDEDNYDEDNIDCNSIIYTDAAKKNFGDMWTIPLHKHFQELIDECTWEWARFDNHWGYKVVGNNRRYIFLPVVDSKRLIGSYWCFSLNRKDARYADFCFLTRKT